MASTEVAVASKTVLIRDDHPDFLDLVAEVVQWAESLDKDDPERPSAWFLSLLGKWVDEDRRVPVMELKRPSEVSSADEVIINPADILSAI